MNDKEWLAQRFEGQRATLRRVAYRMLGSAAEADDAVQEAWIRLSRSDIDQIDNLGGWLTTVVARVCLDMLRSRASRREDDLEPETERLDDAAHPEDEAILADSIGVAMLVVLDTLTPAARVAFVLHDMFAVPFDEIAPIVGRSETATRKLASRARTRVQGSDAPQADPNRHRHIVAAFLSAARDGNFATLLALLDPDVALIADKPAPKMGTERTVVGAQAVATIFSGAAHGAELALINRSPGLIWVASGQPRAVFDFTLIDDRIVRIELISERTRIDDMDLELLT